MGAVALMRDRPNPSSSSWAFLFIAAVFLMPYFMKRPSSPRNRFSATVSPFRVPSSWTMTATPWWLPSTWFLGAICSPSSVKVPEPIGRMPVSMLVNVDLPEPFSPIRAWISPA